MKHAYFFTSLALLILSAQLSRADEGMWLINDYKGQAWHNVVSIDFMGTGSIISEKGLVITNHHVAYSDICSLSSTERNLLKEGFWARSYEEELPVSGRKMQVLVEMKDITHEVQIIKDSIKKTDGRLTSRKLAYLIEKKYSEESGLEASLDAMWAGAKYYISLYRTYPDIRLVAAPPESVGSFGGDVDNWEWPQHKCDFALYRIYAAPDGSPSEYSENNIPLECSNYLKISTTGYKLGDPTTVIGYPGRTHRYSSTAEIDYELEIALPLANKLRAEQMQIIKQWMSKDPEIRLKYSDNFFKLSNLAEYKEGQEACLKRFDVIEHKSDIDHGLNLWINAQDDRKARWGSLTNELESYYASIKCIERAKVCFRETMFRGPIIWRTLMRMSSCKDLDSMKKHLYEGFNETDPRVEKDLIRLSVREFYTHIPAEFWGPYQRELHEKYGIDYDSLTDFIWDNSIFSSTEKASKLESKEDLLTDPLFRFQQDLKITALNKAKNSFENEKKIADLKRKYTLALYAMKADQGIRQYPDANSTMRFTVGKVSKLYPRDAVICDWHSTPKGIFEKYDASKAEFCPPSEFMEAMKRGNWQKWTRRCPMYIDFLTDNDITGGNSGSPVLNRKGEIIGLAFDGNKESLSGDLYYTAEYNKCVCVDIRYILWVLDSYADMQRIINELNL